MKVSVMDQIDVVVEQLNGRLLPLLLLCLFVLMLATFFRLIRLKLGHKTKDRNGRSSVNALDALIRAEEPVAGYNSDAIGWHATPLMNRSEFRVFEELERLVVNCQTGHRLFSQVPLGEVMRPDQTSGNPALRRKAFQEINSKRVDFILIDRAGFPTIAIEYQGGGHYQGNAIKRDHIKREAFRKIGVPFMEVIAGGLSDGQRLDLKNLLGHQILAVAE
jgi:hypothetical protein